MAQPKLPDPTERTAVAAVGVHGPLAALLVAAGLGAAVVVGVALVAARSLEQRNAAVRDGVLLHLAHEAESALREAGPAGAEAVLDGVVHANLNALAGIELVGGRGTLISAGRPGQNALEVPAMLGPAWRGMVAPGIGGGGPGAGFRGAGARLRLTPTAGLGGSGLLPTVVVAGALLSAVGLIVLAVLAARGFAERERRLALEAGHARLAALAQAGAGLAHRVRNPLAAVKGTAQTLAEHGDQAVRGRAERIVTASERIESLLGRLLDFARPPESHPERVDLTDLAGRVAERANGRVRVIAPAATLAVADPEQIESILEELIANARAFDPDGELEVEVAQRGDRATVEVRDRGTGLALDPERAFEPYVTTRADGTGLGLAIVRALALANRGSVTLAARAGGGCVATLVLPAGGA